jgi:hypothetical protein
MADFNIMFPIKYDINVKKAVIRAVFSKLGILKVDFSEYITIVKHPRMLPMIPSDFALGCVTFSSLLAII